MNSSATSLAATGKVPDRDIGIITIISVCHGLSHFYQLVTPALFVLIAPALDVSYSQLATTILVFSIVSSIGQPLSGVYVDRFGGLSVLIAGTLLYSCGILLYSIAQGWLSLLAAALVAGLGNSIYHPSDLSIINHRVSHRRIPVAYSCHVIGGQIGWALAPVSMTALALVLDWRLALVVAALPGFVLTVFLCFCRAQLSYRIELPETVPENQSKTTARYNNASLVQMLAIPWIWLMMLFFAMHSVATMPVAQFGQVIFAQLYALDRETISVYISLFLLFSCLGTIGGGLVLSKGNKSDTIAQSDNYQFAKANSLTILAMSIAAAGYILIPAVDRDSLIIALAVVGLGVGFTSPLRDTLVRIQARGRNQGKAYGIVYSGLDIGMLCAPLLGLLIDWNLAELTFYIPGLASCTAVLIVLASRYNQSFVKEPLIK